ncbi:MAG: 23S rRNA (pseudouridine(1915)-N(3))-methyltransferase RlmH [Candidatus Omnitrophota bacterium]
MKIVFHLGWVSPKDAGKRAFRDIQIRELFRGYCERISKFSPCAQESLSGLAFPVPSGEQVWLCHRGPGAKILSSEDLSASLARAQNEGTRVLRVLIGGADGFSPQEIRRLEPRLLWSFGPLTLPHELAAVVAAEQMYRAWTILRRLPYHLGH